MYWYVRSMVPVSACTLALVSAAPPACPAGSVRNSTAFHSVESFITIAVDDPLACCATCVGNASCASWTAQGKLCHLKHGLPPDGGEHSPGSVSGAIPGREPPPWPAPPSSHKLKNVVLVISDDMRPSLGAYGQPAISPHLDAFARQGTVFQSAYVQVAWCSPCRNSFLSGRRPDRTHIWTTPGTEPVSSKPSPRVCDRPLKIANLHASGSRIPRARRRLGHPSWLL